MEDQERKWLEEYRRGDTEALGRLVEHYRRPLYAFILKMVDMGSAEEIFQDTWIRAIRNLDRFEARNLLGWLFRIARNLVVDRSRRDRLVLPGSGLGSSSANQTDWAQTVPSSDRGPASEAHRADLRHRIDRAVSLLPAEQREVFLLRMEGGMPFREIARIQGTGINTALARMHYAVMKLREDLKDEFDGLKE
jgi:RNA polymerase sigma-70 factor (ECF subfamily)